MSLLNQLPILVNKILVQFEGRGYGGGGEELIGQVRRGLQVDNLHTNCFGLPVPKVKGLKCRFIK